MLVRTAAEAAGGAEGGAGKGVIRSLVVFEDEAPALALPFALARSALATRRSLALPSLTSR